MKRSLLSRRALIGGGMAGSALLACPAIAKVASSQSPVFETASGKIRGISSESVSICKGIPYASPVAAGNRFKAPRPVEPWPGIRDARVFGPQAMQGAGDPSSVEVREFRQWQATETGRLQRGLFIPPPVAMSENCQYLNVWTPADSQHNGNRPVLFWLHGGGFTGGSGDWGWTDGASLARHHDMVVVSINHRLNVFGYLYLAELGGADFADSGNVGMLDIVAALKWVRDNVSAFGGDPGNVTIMGQSGGGMKVNVLMAMPAAQRLFHKAVNLSGPCDRMPAPGEATANTVRLLSHLGLSNSDIGQLQTMRSTTLLRACSKVEDFVWRNGTHLTQAFAPVVDGRSLPRQPFDPDAPEISARIPMMVGNCADEMGPNIREFVKTHQPFGDSQAAIELQKMGFTDTVTKQLLQRYRESRPEASAGDVFAAIKTDAEFRMGGIAICERKSRRPASVFAYLFSRKTTAIGSSGGAAHSMDMPFFFDNLARAPGLAGDPPEQHAQELARHMSSALVAFARTGDPNHAGLPRWEPYSISRRSTMIFDDTSQVVEDPGGEERKAFLAAEALSHFRL